MEMRASYLQRIISTLEGFWENAPLDRGGETFIGIARSSTPSKDFDWRKFDEAKLILIVEHWFSTLGKFQEFESIDHFKLQLKAKDKKLQEGWLKKLEILQKEIQAEPEKTKGPKEINSWFEKVLLARNEHVKKRLGSFVTGAGELFFRRVWKDNNFILLDNIEVAESLFDGAWLRPIQLEAMLAGMNKWLDLEFMPEDLKKARHRFLTPNAVSILNSQKVVADVKRSLKIILLAKIRDYVDLAKGWDFENPNLEKLKDKVEYWNGWINRGFRITSVEEFELFSLTGEEIDFLYSIVAKIKDDYDQTASKLAVLPLPGVEKFERTHWQIGDLFDSLKRIREAGKQSEPRDIDVLARHRSGMFAKSMFQETSLEYERIPVAEEGLEQENSDWIPKSPAPKQREQVASELASEKNIATTLTTLLDSMSQASWELGQGFSAFAATMGKMLIGVAANRLSASGMESNAEGASKLVQGKGGDATKDFGAGTLLMGAAEAMRSLAEAFIPTPAAEGGLFTGPTLAMVGEGGQSEAVLPLDRLKPAGGDAGGMEIGKYVSRFTGLREIRPVDRNLRETDARAYLAAQQQANRRLGRRLPGREL